MRVTIALAATAALHGCGGGLSGEVRDAASERPVARARIEVSSVGWGMRSGDLVKDKSTTWAATTDARGHFTVSGVSGGVALRASADGFPPVVTSLCSRSPMIVRLGGPFDGVDVGRTLQLTTRLGWRFGGAPDTAPREAADLTIDSLPQSGAERTTFHAPLGLAFSPGTGNPATPPAFGQATSIELALLTQCGWLFVQTRDGGTAAVRIGSYGIDEPVGGEQALMLSYGLLPRR